MSNTLTLSCPTQLKHGSRCCSTVTMEYAGRKVYLDKTRSNVVQTQDHSWKGRCSYCGQLYSLTASKQEENK